MHDKYGVYVMDDLSRRLVFGSIGSYSKGPEELIGRTNISIIAEFPTSKQAFDLQAKLNNIINQIRDPYEASTL